EAVTHRPYVIPEILPDEPAMPRITVAIISVGSITGVVVVCIGVCPNANPDWPRAYPYALRIRRHCQCNTSRSQDSNCKFPHENIMVAALGETPRALSRS